MVLDHPAVTKSKHTYIGELVVLASNMKFYACFTDYNMSSLHSFVPAGTIMIVTDYHDGSVECLLDNKAVWFIEEVLALL